MSMIIIVAVACLVASIAAVMSVTLVGSAGRTLIRKVFLVVMNVNPALWGTWKAEFSRREIFLSAWFLVFVLTLIIEAVVAWHGVAT